MSSLPLCHFSDFNQHHNNYAHTHLPVQPSTPTPQHNRQSQPTSDVFDNPAYVQALAFFEAQQQQQQQQSQLPITDASSNACLCTKERNHTFVTAHHHLRVSREVDRTNAHHLPPQSLPQHQRARSLTTTRSRALPIPSTHQTRLQPIPGITQGRRLTNPCTPSRSIH